MVGLCRADRRSPSACSRRCRGGFVPAQDKQYLVAFAQLPDGATLDRTEEVIRRMGEIALKQPGVENAVAFPGLSINGFTNSSERGHRVRHAEAVRGAQGARARARAAIAGSSTGKFAGDPGRLHRHVPAAAGARASAPSAASSCSSRTAPGSAMRRSTTPPRRSSARRIRRPSSPGCSRATRSTCRSSTPTSTAPRRGSSACR